MSVATFVEPPTPAEVLAFGGLPVEDAELLELARVRVGHLVEAVRVHTRGVGFDGDHLAPALASVVTSAASRAVTNPNEDRRVEVGGFSRLPADPGWSLRELAVLNSFRRRVG